MAKLSTTDEGFMAAALSLARRGLGQVAPNPSVGCVIVRDGRVVGRGWTQPGGRPHAETEALACAGEAARGATAYVTLEPCSHHGRTPPCTDALIAAGIARCVIACVDPDTRVNGNGVEQLRAAGVAVEIGLLEAEARRINEGFFLARQADRPLVTLKLATSIDGKIATHSGESRWITGDEARARVHLMRAGHDAVMVGSGTAVADDPRLDVRLPGLGERKPVRVVLDGRLRLPLTHDLVRRAAEQPTWLVTRGDAETERVELYREAGVEVLPVATDEAGNLSLRAVLSQLAGRGLTRVLCEGGGHLAAALLRGGFVDRLAWFRAPMAIGGDGHPAVAGFGLDRLASAPRFERLSAETLGEDLLETFRRRA